MYFADSLQVLEIVNKLTADSKRIRKPMGNSYDRIQMWGWVEWAHLFYFHSHTLSLNCPPPKKRKERKKKKKRKKPLHVQQEVLSC